MKNRISALRVLTGSVAICISAAQLFTAAVIYEPFDYPAGSLDGAGGTTDIGFTGNWIAVNAWSIQGRMHEGRDQRE